MKTSGHYFFQLAKLIGFVLLMAWLCSACSNRKQYIIDKLHAYNDSIGMAKQLLFRLDYQMHQFRQGYESNYPPKVFALTEQGERERKQWLIKERAAYKAMNEIMRVYERNAYPEKLNITERISAYRKKIDSLKIELYGN